MERQIVVRRYHGLFYFPDGEESSNCVLKEEVVERITKDGKIYDTLISIDIIPESGIQ